MKVMADLRLSIAKSTYILQFTHSISCPNCIHGEPCYYTARNTFPTPSNIVAATRHQNAISMLASTHHMPTSVRALLGLDPRQLVNASGSMGSSLGCDMDEEWMTPPALSEEPSLTSILNATEDYESSEDISSAFPSSEGLDSEEPYQEDSEEQYAPSALASSNNILSANPSPSEHVSLAVARPLSKKESSFSSLNFDGQDDTAASATT